MISLLIVDDEVMTVSLLKDHVDWRKTGVDKVFFAYTAKEARKVVNSGEIDIILCDIEMPQENGLIFLKWVSDNYPEIQRIILTGYPDFKYAQDAISVGVLKYMLKPVSFSELTDTVSHMAVRALEYQRKRQFLGETDRKDKWKKEKNFYISILTGNTLPFPEFIAREARLTGERREDLEPGGLVSIRAEREASETRKYRSLLLDDVKNASGELSDRIVEVHLWELTFWIIKGACERKALAELCQAFLSCMEKMSFYGFSVCFTCDVNLETLAEKANNLMRTPVQLQMEGAEQAVLDADSLMEVSVVTDDIGRSVRSGALVKTVKSYVQEHYMEPLSREDIEREVHINRDHLNRIFKNATGYSLMQYIQYYRILMSKKLFAEKHYSITEVGALVGFDTPSYFAKIFKKWEHITPYEYCQRLEQRS